MASQFVAHGDLFVEFVDNADASDSPTRDAARMAAIRDGTFETGPHRFDRYNGYNGIRQLYSRRGPSDNIFGVAGGSSLNFEFVYDMKGSSFRPRWVDGRPDSAPTPGALSRVDEASVLLETWVQPPSQIDVRTTFSVVAPCYIDMTTVILPHSGSFNGDWLGLFWANYIRQPDEKTTYLRAHDLVKGRTDWAATLAEDVPGARAFASEREMSLLAGEPDPGGRLFHNIRPLRYVEPLMYGCWRHMVLAMMFRTDENLRLAIQPTGGGPRNPAWDFGVVIKDCQPDHEYSWRARMVFKPFAGPEDVHDEYQLWQRYVLGL